jgi:hypothetical protein
MRFRLDPASALGPARESECRLSLNDLNADSDGEDPTLVLAQRGDGGVDVLVERAESIGRAELSHSKLAPCFRDYRHVIEQLARVGAGSGAAHLETLDYAKKLVHDEAGDLVRAALAPLVSVPHDVARRLFTLMFLMASDLPDALVRKHRHSA